MVGPIPPEVLQHNSSGRLDGTQVAELRKDYKMPEAMKGMPVTWYEYPNGGRGVTGICAAIHKDTIDVFLPADSGYLRTGVRYIKDPMVFGQGYDPVDGCWDYTEYYCRTVVAVSELEKRVARLEKKLATTTPNKS